MKRITTLLFIVLMTVISASFVTAQTAPSGALAGGAATNSAAFRQEGIASWYGPEFDGRPTASGEIFDSSKFTAAHPSLPFGTVLTVTNSYNGRQVTVRVNDRGPFVASRIIDLSMAAAESLDMLLTGTAPVVVEAAAGTAAAAQTPASPPAVVAPPVTQAAPTAPTATPPAPTAIPTAPTVPASPSVQMVPAAAHIIGGIPAAGTGRHYRLQLGAYKNPRNAVDAFDKLKAVGLNPAYEQLDDLYRVVLPGLNPEDVPAIAEKIFAAGFAEALIREER